MRKMIISIILTASIIGISFVISPHSKNTEVKKAFTDSVKLKQEVVLSEKENSGILKEKTKNTIELKNIEPDLQPELTDEERIAEFEKQLANELKAEIGEDAFKNSYAGKMLTKDPKVTIKLSEHDPERQKIMKEEIEFIKVNGYSRLSQNEMDDYYKTEAELFSQGNAEDSAKFKLAKVPKDLELSYVGYTREGLHPFTNGNVKAPVIRRVYYFNNATILLQEEDSKNGVTHFTQEFVNENIGEYPGIFATYRSPDNKIIHEIQWNTDNHRYQINSISNKSSDEERIILRKLAQEITELNKSK